MVQIGLDLRPRALIRDAKVVGFIPSNSAAPRGPEILPFVWAKAERILSRSRRFSSESVKLVGAGLRGGAKSHVEPPHFAPPYLQTPHPNPPDTPKPTLPSPTCS